MHETACNDYFPLKIIMWLSVRHFRPCPHVHGYFLKQRSFCVIWPSVNSVSGHWKCRFWKTPVRVKIFRDAGKNSFYFFWLVFFVWQVSDCCVFIPLVDGNFFDSVGRKKCVFENTCVRVDKVLIRRGRSSMTDLKKKCLNKLHKQTWH